MTSLSTLRDICLYYYLLHLTRIKIISEPFKVYISSAQIATENRVFARNFNPLLHVFDV